MWEPILLFFKVIEPLAVTASAIAVLFTAVFVSRQVSAIYDQIFSHRETTQISIEAQAEAARLRATLDVILRSQQNAVMLELRDKFVQIRKDGGFANHAADPTNTDPDSPSLTIRKYLNYYELVAVAIDRGIIDDLMFRQYWKTTLIQDWEETSAFVTEIRRLEKSDVFYRELENLARRWKNEKG